MANAAEKVMTLDDVLRKGVTVTQAVETFLTDDEAIFVASARWCAGINGFIWLEQGDSANDALERLLRSQQLNDAVTIL